MSRYFSNFRDACDASIAALLHEGVDVDSGRWQGIPTEGHPSLITRELLNLNFEVPIDRHMGNPSNALETLAAEIKPNREWADEHFDERVGGKPLNPDPSHVRWPHWRGQDAETKVDGKFTHTYSERFWPRHASGYTQHHQPDKSPSNHGIRFEYGDYEDVLTLLYDEPMTRQATLPIFFPEDTGAVHGGRIPCTLHYHFLRRNDRLHLWYPIRSCDAYRHFRDDVYLAARLMLHTLGKLKTWDQVRDEGYQQWDNVKPGTLYFTAYSFHVHHGDMHHLRSN